MILLPVPHFQEALKQALLSVLSDNPSLSATLKQSPKIGLPTTSSVLSPNKMDTFNKKKDTPKSYNIYLHNEIYYFRTRINGKLYRKSLKTSSLKVAIIRTKLLKSCKKEELLKMFEIKNKDFGIICEYETMEELEKLLEFAKRIKNTQIQQDFEDKIKDRTLTSVEENKLIQIQEKTRIPLPNSHNQEYYNFEMLQIEFISYYKKLGKVSESSFKNYNSAFNKLNEFFRSEDINKLKNEDFENFRSYLIELNLSNKTINNLIGYVSRFLEFGKTRGKVFENYCKGVESLKEEKVKLENFTDQEIQEILFHTKRLLHKPHMYAFFLIGAYTGMRFNEILDIQEDSIKELEGVKYIDITHSKTSNGIRKVPLHPLLQDFDFSILYSFSSKEKNKYDKEMLRVLYSIIPKEKEKTFHTLRGTFIQKLVNIDSKEISLIQEIVGHSQGKQSLTLQTYAKEFYLPKKFEILKQVEYNKL